MSKQEQKRGIPGYDDLMNVLNARNPADLMIIVTLVMVIGVGAAWLFMGSEDPSEDAPASATVLAPHLDTFGSPPEAVSAESIDIEVRLEKARLALTAGQHIEPKNNSAIFHFHAALQLDPGNPEAREGLDSIIRLVMDDAEAAILDDRFDDAVGLIGRVKPFYSNHPRIMEVEHQLEEQHNELVLAALKLTEKGDFDGAEAQLEQASRIPDGDTEVFTRAQELLAEARETAAQEAERQAKAKTEAPRIAEAKQEPTKPPSQVEILLEKASTSLTAGRLMSPNQDNAEYYLSEVRKLDPQNPVLAERLELLSETLIARAKGESSVYQFDDAYQTLDRAESLGLNVEVIAQTRIDVDARRREIESQTVIPASNLEVVKHVPPEYPGLAVRRGAEGWVELEFTVTRDGDTSDIQVVDAEREGYFEDAAVAAVSQWQFVPRMFRGEVIDQRVSIRVTFEFE